MKPIRPVIREVESPIHQSNVSGPARRQSAKQWRISDRLLAVFLLFVAVASLVADVMVIYIYLTNDAQLIPTLADNPWHAYLWATVPLIMVTAIAMLPYFGSARKKVQFRLVYSALAIILFVFACEQQLNSCHINYG